jgi:hypothetical protein
MERSTRQRSAIRSAIDAAGRPLSPQEVLDAAQAEVPGLSQATVYRNLKLLLDAAEVAWSVCPATARATKQPCTPITTTSSASSASGFLTFTTARATWTR